MIWPTVIRGFSERTGPGRSPASAGARARSSASESFGHVPALEDDLPRWSAARAGGCSGRWWSCRSPTRRPARGSRRAGSRSSRRPPPARSPAAAAEQAPADLEVLHEVRGPRAAISALARARRGAGLRSARQRAGSWSCTRRSASQHARTWLVGRRPARGGGTSTRSARPVGAARRERASGGQAREIGRLARDGLQPRPARLVQPRHRAQQAQRVGMARVGVDLARRRRAPRSCPRT